MRPQERGERISNRMRHQEFPAFQRQRQPSSSTSHSSPAKPHLPCYHHHMLYQPTKMSPLEDALLTLRTLLLKQQKIKNILNNTRVKEMRFAKMKQYI